MTRKYVVPQDGSEGSVEEDSEESDDIDDPTVALLACLLLQMTCPKCAGLGVVGKNKRCDCREVGHAVAVTVLEQEGLVGT